MRVKSRVLNWIVCPLCRSALDLEPRDSAELDDLESGSVRCIRGHRFPVTGGVPRLVPEHRFATEADSRAIEQSFSREWQHFNYEEDRTWGQTVNERRADFLRHVDLPSAALENKLVLDAGCGNGALSVAISTFGCQVVATDISDSVFGAHRHFRPDRTHFVQSDLMHPAFRDGIFDVVYCAGVLHHTPDTHATLANVVRAVAPGGSIFIWLYWRVPGVGARLSETTRRVLAPLPAPLKHAIVRGILLPQAVARERLRAHRNSGARPLNWREIFVRQLDSFTPRYRWVHTPAEVHDWYRGFGLVSAKTTEEGEWGFGVVARKPRDDEKIPTRAAAEAVTGS